MNPDDGWCSHNRVKPVAEKKGNAMPGDGIGGREESYRTSDTGRCPGCRQWFELRPDGHLRHDEALCEVKVNADVREHFRQNTIPHQLSGDLAQRERDERLLRVSTEILAALISKKHVLPNYLRDLAIRRELVVAAVQMARELISEVGD